MAGRARTSSNGRQPYYPHQEEEHATEHDADQNLACRSAAPTQGVGGHAGTACQCRDHGPRGHRCAGHAGHRGNGEKAGRDRVDCIGDGEFWTARSLAHYTAHFTGIEARPVVPGEPPTTRHSTRERDEFPDFYGDLDRAGTLFLVPGEKPTPPVTVRVVARDPVKSKGPEGINRQLDTFKAAIERCWSATAA